MVMRVVVEEVHKWNHHRLLENIHLLCIGETVGHHEGDQLLEKLLAMKRLPAWMGERERQTTIFGETPAFIIESDACSRGITRQKLACIGSVDVSIY